MSTLMSYAELKRTYLGVFCVAAHLSILVLIVIWLLIY